MWYINEVRHSRGESNWTLIGRQSSLLFRMPIKFSRDGRSAVFMLGSSPRAPILQIITLFVSNKC